MQKTIGEWLVSFHNRAYDFTSRNDINKQLILNKNKLSYVLYKTIDAPQESIYTSIHRPTPAVISPGDVE